MISLLRAYSLAFAALICSAHGQTKQSRIWNPEPYYQSGRKGNSEYYCRKVPFQYSQNKGEANRLQGIKHPASSPDDSFLYCVTDRTWKDAGGRTETLAALAAKGHTHFRSNFDPKSEPMYAPGFQWLSYNNCGTNQLPHELDHHPDRMLTFPLQKLYDLLKLWVHQWPSELGFKIYIGNFEYFMYTWDADKNISPLYQASPLKDEKFLSAFDGRTRSMREVFEGAGKGREAVDLLNAHLSAKRRQFDSLLIQLMKRRNPGLDATNGDVLFYHVLNPNGELIANGQSYDIRDYKKLDYETLRQAGGLDTVSGGKVRFEDGQTFDLSGFEADHWTVFNNYYYYMDVFIRKSDYEALMASKDPAHQTVDYWNSKFFPAPMNVYALPACWEFRRHFFNEHKKKHGRDFNTYRQIDMMEHQYEVGKTTLVADDSDEVNMKTVGDAPAPFMKGFPDGLFQLLQVPRELIWMRKIQARMLMDGQFVWWEGCGKGEFDFDYSKGKYAHFHLRSQEEHQHAWDFIQQDRDIFGKNSALTIEGIKSRWRRNQGSWSEWKPSLSPVHAAFQKNVEGHRTPQPYILKRSKPGKAFYAFFCAQNRRDVTEMEFQHDDEQVYSTRMIGIMPSTLVIRTGK